MNSTASDKEIIITTGDTDGIGLEVTLKALREIDTSQHFVYTVYLHENSMLQNATTIKALQDNFANHLNLIPRKDNPAFWVCDAARTCLKNKNSALVTGPLSKETVVRAGLKDMGHTGILKRISRAKNVRMCFLGSKFNVILVTDHLPIKNVSRSINSSLIKTTVQSALNIRKILPKAKRDLPVAVLGLNPHAGENGLIGQEELRTFRMIKRMKNVVGPLSPDAAFLPNHLSKYSFFVCSYHDQGLIPFKMAHGQDSGVHITLGIPFVRTSVDHGTAKDIFGLNKANPNSMREAIETAQKLISGGTYGTCIRDFSRI